MIPNILAAATASLGFAVLYGVPAALWWASALVGGTAWGIVLFAQMELQVGPIAALVLGAATTALLSEILARRLRQPVTMFLVPGIIPLVPGGRAYMTMLYFLQGDSVAGIASLLETVFAAGAIAIGMILISSLFRVRSLQRASIGSENQ